MLHQTFFVKMHLCVLVESTVLFYTVGKLDPILSCRNLIPPNFVTSLKSCSNVSLWKEFPSGQHNKDATVIPIWKLLFVNKIFIKKFWNTFFETSYSSKSKSGKYDIYFKWKLKLHIIDLYSQFWDVLWRNWKSKVST